jgi:hypothetical protein
MNDDTMSHDDHLNEHVELCKRVYERMRRDNSWPWVVIADSTETKDLVESNDNPRLS